MTSPHPTDGGFWGPKSGYFKTTGYWRAVVDPSVSGSYSMPDLVNVSALVTFVPRIPVGSLLYTEPDKPGDNAVAVALAPRYARIWKGELCNINVADSPGVLLAANTAKLNLLDSIGLGELIYDVSFTKVTFGGKPTTYDTLPGGAPAPTITVSGDQQLTSFAFIAPTDPNEVVCLTDVGLKRLPYSKQPGPQAPVG